MQGSRLFRRGDEVITDPRATGVICAVRHFPTMAKMKCGRRLAGGAGRRHDGRELGVVAIGPPVQCSCQQSLPTPVSL